MDRDQAVIGFAVSVDRVEVGEDFAICFAVTVPMDNVLHFVVRESVFVDPIVTGTADTGTLAGNFDHQELFARITDAAVFRIAFIAPEGVVIQPGVKNQTFGV